MAEPGWRVLFIVGGLQFMYLLDYMWLMPLGPALMQARDFDALGLGVLMSGYAWASGGVALAAVPWLERWPRPRLLRWLTLGFVLAQLACAWAPGWGWLLVARVAAGAVGGVLSVVSKAWLTDLVAPERQGRAWGWVMLSFALASVVGVPAALLLASRFGVATPFLALALCGALMLALLQGIASSPARPEARAPRGWRPLLMHPSHRWALALSSAFMVAGFAFTPFIPTYLQRNGGLDAWALAQIYGAGGVVALVGSVLVGHGCDRFGALAVFRVLALLAVPVVLGIAVLEPLSVALGGEPGHLALLPTALAVGLLFLTVNGRMVAGTALVTSAAEPAQRAAFLALNSAVQSAAVGLASMAGAWLVGGDAVVGLRHAWRAAALAALASLVSVWLALRLHALVARRQR